MQIRWLLAGVILVGASAQSNSGNSSEENATHPPPAAVSGSNAGLNPASPDQPYWRDFPLRSYRGFPAGVRALLRRADVAQEHCSSVPDADGYRACNRAWRIRRELARRRGWCWGSERRMRVSADEHWLRCSRDPTYRLGYEGPRPPFSEREIREIAAEGGH